MKRKDVKAGMRVFVGRKYGDEAYIMSDEANWVERTWAGRSNPEVAYQADYGKMVAIAKRESYFGGGTQWRPAVASLSQIKPWDEHQAELDADKAARQAAAQRTQQREGEMQANEDRINSRMRTLLDGEPGTRYAWVEWASGRVKLSVEAMDRLLDVCEQAQLDRLLDTVE